MGCSSCKGQKEMSPEENLLNLYEKTLGVHNLKLITIDRVLHRYSTNSGMSVPQFERAFSELSLDFKAFESFYSRFYDKYQYNMKKLNCLGILLCQDAAPLKLKILFQNYDTETSGKLSRDDLESMLNDLTQIACVIIPKGALAQNSNRLLEDYLEKVKSVRKSLIRQLVASMMENKESINEREFNFCYQRDEGVRNILSTRAMREYCFYIKRDLMGSVDDILMRMSTGNPDMMMIGLLKKRDTKRRRTKKAKTRKEEI